MQNTDWVSTSTTQKGIARSLKQELLATEAIMELRVTVEETQLQDMTEFVIKKCVIARLRISPTVEKKNIIPEVQSRSGNSLSTLGNQLKNWIEHLYFLPSKNVWGKIDFLEFVQLQLLRCFLSVTCTWKLTSTLVKKKNVSPDGLITLRKNCSHSWKSCKSAAIDVIFSLTRLQRRQTLLMQQMNQNIASTTIPPQKYK